MPSCDVVSYIEYAKTCDLQKNARNHYPVWKKAVNLGAVSAIKNDFAYCHCYFDMPGEGDVFALKGSFNDCRRCVADTKRANAFTWFIESVDSMDQPLEEYGYLLLLQED